jgi:hypothetical protein
MIMFISIDALYCLIFSEIILDKQLENLSVDWDLRKSNENSTCNLGYGNLIEPRMFPNVCYLESSFRISVEDL